VGLIKRKEMISTHKYKKREKTALARAQKNRSSKVVEDSSNDKEERIE